jgi:hypothetical protein
MKGKYALKAQEKWLRMKDKAHVKVYDACGLTLFVFGLLGWLYSVLIQVTHPEWLSLSLAHYQVAPLDIRVDDSGILAFALSAFGFFLWRIGAVEEESNHPLISRRRE